MRVAMYSCNWFVCQTREWKTNIKIVCYGLTPSARICDPETQKVVHKHRQCALRLAQRARDRCPQTQILHTNPTHAIEQSLEDDSLSLVGSFFHSAAATYSGKVIWRGRLWQTSFMLHASLSR